MIYLTRYVKSKSIKMLSLYYHESMWNIEEHEGKKYLMVDDYMLDKVINSIEEIIDLEKLADDNTFKNVILMTCVIKYDGNFYAQLFLEEALLQA